MGKIIFEGWNVGMKKISFIELLHEQAGLSLKESKSIKDRLVNDDEIIEVEIKDDDLLKQIVENATRLGVVCSVKKE